MPQVAQVASLSGEGKAAVADTAGAKNSSGQSREQKAEERDESSAQGE